MSMQLGLAAPLKLILVFIPPYINYIFAFFSINAGLQFGVGINDL